MKTKQLAALIALCATIQSCASGPPQAPTVGEFRRKPVNTQTALDLQSCRGDLTNTRSLLEETSRIANSAQSALAQMAVSCAAQPKAPTPQSFPAPTASAFPSAAAEQYGVSFRRAAFRQLPPPTGVFIILFPFAETELQMTDDAAAKLAAAVQDARFIVVHGRTDGVIETHAESRIARGRSDAVRAHLIGLGIPAELIRTTYQPVGDYIGDNATEAGRKLNRRVEIEIHRVLPSLEMLEGGER